MQLSSSLVVVVLRLGDGCELNAREAALVDLLLPRLYPVVGAHNGRLSIKILAGGRVIASVVSYAESILVEDIPAVLSLVG